MAKMWEVRRLPLPQTKRHEQRNPKPTKDKGKKSKEQAKPVTIVVGSHIWVENPVWIDGEVLNIKGDDAEIQTSGGSKVVAKLSKIYPKDTETPPGGVDDMTKLSYLHEPGVLHNLATRYEINEIYTYTGNILIAINPFQSLSHMYDADMMERYNGVPYGELRPHVFAIADAAYREMIKEGKGNSILVSGESGAGKTETTKMLMRYLAYLGGNAAAEGRTVEQKVLESNPVLEAFGNAKTVRNNNSSRFGKFVEIQFDKCGRISGAAIRTYLLERSRVCQISDSERNYHCFYLLCAAPPQEIEKYKLGEPKLYHYLNQSNCYELDGTSDQHNYLSTRRAMDVVGINAVEQTFKDHKRFIKPKLTRSDFTIVHYAGEVQYQSDQFLDKNKDYIVPEHRDLLSASTCSFVAGLFPPLTEEVAKSSKFSSISSRFKLQLQQLMEILNSTEPHYIRCIKPNNVLKPAVFENDNVMQQLRSGGVLEAVRIKCAGYPTYRSFSEFLSRFRVLAPEVLKMDCPENEACEKILVKMGLRGYQVGKTKVFLRAGQMAELDAKRILLLGDSSKVIQTRGRTRITRKKYVSTREASICVQSFCKGELVRKLFKLKKREISAVKIQKTARKRLARKDYLRIKFASTILQAGVRAVAARDEFRYRVNAAIIIQTGLRAMAARYDFRCRINAAVIIQTGLRAMAARDVFRCRINAAVIIQTGLRAMAARDVFRCRAQSKPKVIVQTDLETKIAETPKLEPSVQANVSKVDGTDLLLYYQTDLEKEKVEEATNVESSLLTNVSRGFEIDALSKSQVAQVEIEDACSITEDLSSPDQNAERVKILTAEVESLKVMLQAEKQRANECERRYVEARVSSEEGRRKLEETERIVLQLQESLNRMIYCMSNQVSELKTILSTASKSSSTTSGPLVRHEGFDSISSNSDYSSTDSDFTFPAPATSSANFSSTGPSSIQLIVQDVSGGEVSGSENEKEGAFDDFF
ncbi:hypothetical protein C1H46_000757 [Malus baccata]|uniref:Myosin motor domain-containing protein n=1 Tax=Malus baccata TaxID=106549 RepID=A0A540NT55_MALBA|nr:hypothetical protein C1H46_000757 [Malus baccata]